MKQMPVFLLMCMLHFNYGHVCAIDTQRDTLNIKNRKTAEIEWPSATSVFLELAGKGLYSVNVDFRKSLKSAFSIGVEYFEGVWPSFMYYHLGGERNRFESGGGVSGIITNSGLRGFAIHGVLGYRFQKRDGLFLRAGFTPFAGIPLTSTGRFKIVPLIGVSLGYCF